MFREMYSMCTSAIEALAYFKEWYGMVIRSQLKPMMEAAKSFKRHWDQIATFFVHYHGTAHSEGMNSKVQALIKRANGYRNRKRLINDLYFHLGGLSLYPETPN
jgi:transposase